MYTYYAYRHTIHIYKYTLNKFTVVIGNRNWFVTATGISLMKFAYVFQLIMNAFLVLIS